MTLPLMPSEALRPSGPRPPCFNASAGSNGRFITTFLIKCYNKYLIKNRIHFKILKNLVIQYTYSIEVTRANGNAYLKIVFNGFFKFNIWQIF